MWINIKDRLPKQKGFYIVLSRIPYSSWAFLDNNDDRYMDCQAFSFFNGRIFNAFNVEWWLETPEKPKDWSYNEKEE